MSLLKDLPYVLQLDFNDLIVGEELGRGTYRRVYDCKIDPTIVFKFETADTREFANVQEWNLWNETEDDPFQKWLAPCVNISSNGTCLIMRKTTPLSANYKLPRMVPNILSDLAERNWGLYKGKPVMHDYGNSAAYHIMRKHMKLRDRTREIKDW